jgi:hypothetical protein
VPPLLSLGCTCDDTDSAPVQSPRAAVAASAAVRPVVAAAARSGFELISHLGLCEIRHRGLSIDMGTAAVGARRGFTAADPEAYPVVDRAGASFERVMDSRLDVDFWLDEEQPEGLLLSARLHGAAARLVTAYADGKRLGTAKLSRGETRVVTLSGARFKLGQGRHTLTLRFGKATRAPGEAFAEVDWIRIGASDDAAATYAAPTHRDVVSDFELHGQPKRSILLRAPSSLRCPLLPSDGSALHVALGFWGNGRGDVEVRVVQDEEPPVTMQQRKIQGGSSAKWIPLQIDLDQYVGELIGLELRVLRATGGGRIAFGEPVVAQREQSDTRVPEARAAVVVVAAGLRLGQVPPWGAIGERPALGELARTATAFTRYRVPTTVPAAVFASMLSGVSPRSHSLEDPAARLPATVRVISQIVKEATGRTALFTGVPTSFKAFGFDQGWDRFQMSSPVEDLPATAPYEEAARWLEQAAGAGDDSRLLLVVHARGAHPPWDLSSEEALRLRPAEYAGVLDPRRGGITLGSLRGRRPTQQRLSEEDWERLKALQYAALGKQDAGLGRLIGVLKSSGLWDQTLLVFVGDVAAGDPPALPYAPAGPLTEDRLLVPLLVKFPGRQPRVRESAVAVNATDITYTILEALRVAVPAQIEGIDLYRCAAGLELSAGRAQVATLGPHYATRVGTWLLSGQLGRVPMLCKLDIDPACVTDVYDAHPIAAQATWRLTYFSEISARAPARCPATREPASLDPDTTAALTVWGDLE